ncbi:MAG TPA: AMP-binding protein [Thermoanaerobaculia bacterium]|jgi:acyl carrier protein|nr:AMP-binding protein [Thermoanaerobaculia bacterium]
MELDANPTAAVVAASAAERLLATVRALLVELHPRQAERRISLDSALERDLGLDSLARAELLLRLEQAFGVALPERLLAEAETPRDLLQAIERSAPGAGGASLSRAEASIEPAILGAGESAPESAPTLPAVLAWHAEHHGERRHLLFLETGAATPLTYGELQRRAETIAAALLARGLEPRQTVALMLPSGLDYFACFLGILLAGGIPVPLYPPARKSQVEDHLRRQAGILRNAQVRVLIAAPEVRTLARLLVPLAPELRFVTTPGELASETVRAVLPRVDATDVAFIQYTSGSTGDPKGVVLTHQNLLANLRSVGKTVHFAGDDVIVSWLPLYHDMGLIGAWMGSLYFGLPLVLMSPLSFLARPVAWLQALSQHRGTISAAPNFAYALCMKKVADEDLAGLDLSAWRVAMNGAEPVSPEVVEGFIQRFARCGFRRESMMPVYGLAENSLALAFTPPGRGPRVDVVRRARLQRDGRAQPAPEPVRDGEQQPLRFVSAGVPIADHEVRIVDDSGRELPERHQGRLQFRGPSATSGYFRNPEATARLLPGGASDGWLESGDLAYTAGGELFITGRSKDMIIRAGRNLHPQELEEAVGALSGVRKGCVAVFATSAAGEGTERLVVMAEARPGDAAAGADLRQKIGELAMDLVGSAPDEVALVPPGTVPKTSSGKIRRNAARQLFESGSLGKGTAALWLQLLRLGAAGAMPRLLRIFRRVGDVAWGTWAWILFLLLTPPAWLAVVLLPGRRLRRKAARAAARILVHGTGTPLRAAGLERLPTTPCVVVCNHQSYVDAFLLTALLPSRFTYVVKSELRNHAFTRLPLQALGALFVERFDAEKSLEDARRTTEAATTGDSLVVFPEGTFRRAAGLLPFRLGAFTMAAHANLPVVPIALRGSRSLLRAEQWLPRRALVTATIGDPIAPTGAAFSDAVTLRDEARGWMLAHVNEPDLA